MHWTRRHPRGRPPHPDVLTPAEWRVLELVREGKTNAEIAIDLGLAIPTVKTHVSRIFAKTGTTNRQELASWEGAPSQASRAALSRGFSLPLLGWLSGASTAAKVAGAGAAGVVLVGAIAVVLTMFGSDSVRGVVGSDSGTVTGYYLEWRVESVFVRPALTRPDSRPNLGARPTVLVHREWYVDEYRWRVESESRSPQLHGITSTVGVAAGSNELLLHDRLTETWTRVTPLDRPPAVAGALVGPRPGGDLGEVIAFIAATYGGATVTNVGSSKHLGRDVEQLEFEFDGADHQVSVDRETMTVLLHHITPHAIGQRVRAEVTEFQPQAKIAPALFRLEPPVDLEVLTVNWTTNEHPDCPAPGVAARLPDDYLQVHIHSLTVQVPDGWAVRGGRSTWACGGIREHTWLLPSDGGDGYILLDQARAVSGIPHWLAHGDPVDVGWHPGYQTSEGNIERLIWEQGDVVAMLETDTASIEDLLGIAITASIVEGGPTLVP